MKILHHHLTIAFWLGLVLLGVVLAFSYQYYFLDKKTDQIACTQEAKQCPDGSYVGRAGPNCEFKECPADNGVNFKTSGTVHGKVSIGPLCPVEPCSISTNPYLGKRLIFTRLEESIDPIINVKLSSDGSYLTELPVSNYSITLSDCRYMGCSRVFPKAIRVDANKNLELNIDIDTGIR